MTFLPSIEVVRQCSSQLQPNESKLGSNLMLPQLPRTTVHSSAYSAHKVRSNIPGQAAVLTDTRSRWPDLWGRECQ